MSGVDSLKWMSDQNIGRYRAIAEGCHAHAEQARHAPGGAWLKLAAEWIALAEDTLRRRSNG